MTIDELIQRSGGTAVPVEDRVQVKEITKLNKSIQTLIDRVEKSSSDEKDSNEKLSDRIKKFTDQLVKKPAEKIAPAKMITTTRTDGVKKQKEDSKISNLENKFNTFFKMFKGPTQFANLPNKQMASTIDPTKKKLGGGVGGDGKGGNILTDLLQSLFAGGLTGFMLADMSPQLKKTISDVVNKLMTDVTDWIGKEFSESYNKGMQKLKENMTPGPDGKPPLISPTPDPAGVGKVLLGAGALSAGAVAAAAGMSKLRRPKPEVPKPDGEGGGSGKKPKPETKPKPIPQRIEPTLESQKKIEPPKAQPPKVRPVPIPTPILDEKPKPIETEEQRAARENATKKAQDAERARLEADRKKSLKTIDDVNVRRKPSLMDRLKTGADKLGKSKVGKFLGRVGGKVIAPLAIGLGAYNVANAATTDTEDILGIEGREANLGERVAAGLGALTEEVTFGLVDKEKAGQAIADATRIGPAKDVSKGKIASAIDKKAMDEKKRKEINKQISLNKIKMAKMLKAGDKESAMKLARETVDLKDKLKAIDRGSESGKMVYESSKENADLKREATSGSRMGEMVKSFNNVFNSQNHTNIQAAPVARPRDIASSMELYLAKIR